MTSTVGEAPSLDTPEQAEFRARVREFLAAHAQPKRDGSPWALTFHTDPDDARRAFEAGRAWQQTRFAAGMTGFTYPTEVGGRGVGAAGSDAGISGRHVERDRRRRAMAGSVQSMPVNLRHMSNGVVHGCVGIINPAVCGDE